MTHQVAEYLAAGFAGHVGKPFRREALLAEVLRVAQRR
jgi:CheY-like chemotaxis protein